MNAGEKEPVFVVRRPKLLKSQGPILRLLQKGNELPVVHEGDVHRKSADVREQKKRRQDAEENQQDLSNNRTKDSRRGQTSEAGLLRLRRRIHELLDPRSISKLGGALPTEIMLISHFRLLRQERHSEISAAIGKVFQWHASGARLVKIYAAIRPGIIADWTGSSRSPSRW